MSRTGGIDEAVKMIQGLSREAGKKIIEDIRKRNPQMADTLEKRLLTMDDLQYLTDTMLISLLRDVDLAVFGLALRGVSPDVIESITSRVSTGIRLDIEDTLKGGPQPISKVEDAQMKILGVVRTKIELGHIIIDKDSSETYV